MKLILSLLAGLLSWPILEYALHRYLGHVLKLNTLFKKEHTKHHIETNYFAPVWYKILALIPISALLLTLSALISQSWQAGLLFTLGFCSMYWFYEWTHWRFHSKAPRTKWGMKLRKHHFAHHFHTPKMNHGVTTMLIDKIMGTYLKVDVIKIPKNIPLPWIFEGLSDQINPKLSSDFKLK